MVAGPSGGWPVGSPLANARQAASFCSGPPPTPATIAPGPPDLRTKCMLACGASAALCSAPVLPRRCASLAALAPSGAARPPPLARSRSGLFGPRFAPRLRAPAVPPGAAGRPLCAALRLRRHSLPWQSFRSLSLRYALPIRSRLLRSRSRHFLAPVAGSPLGRPLRGSGPGGSRPGGSGGIAAFFLPRPRGV